MGNTDYLLVIRAGKAVFNQRYARDYKAIRVVVVNAWNVFGTPTRNIFVPLLDALLTSTVVRVVE